jgi:RimJ/RimL family protein N-acetyltransferase
MSVAWLQMPHFKAAEIGRMISCLVPVFVTERLRLRAPKLADYSAYRDVFTSERARYVGGPYTDEGSYNDFCQGIAGWILRGAGMWTVTGHDTDAPLGWIYLWQEFGDPEPELGWILTEAAEGHGYAAESARAVLPHAVALFGAQGFVSYVDAGNTRSARLAVALGAQRDAVAEAQLSAVGEVGLYVYRHSGTGAPV